MVKQQNPCLARVCGVCFTVSPVSPLFCISMGRWSTGQKSRHAGPGKTSGVYTICMPRQPETRTAPPLYRKSAGNAYNTWLDEVSNRNTPMNAGNTTIYRSPCIYPHPPDLGESPEKGLGIRPAFLYSTPSVLTQNDRLTSRPKVCIVMAPELLVYW